MMAKPSLPTKLILGYMIRISLMEQGNQCFTLKWRGESNPWGHFYLKISQQGVFSSQHAAVLQDMAESSFKGRRCFLAVAVVCSCIYVTEITFKKSQSCCSQSSDNPSTAENRTRLLPSQNQQYAIYFTEVVLICASRELGQNTFS